jgi:hypothetical protein
MNAVIKNKCTNCSKETFLNFKSKGNRKGDYICITCLMELNKMLYCPDKNKKPDVLSRAS